MRDNDEHRIMTSEDMNAQEQPVTLQELKELKGTLEQAKWWGAGYGRLAGQVRVIKELGEQFGGLDRLCQILLELEELYPSHGKGG